MNNTWATLAIMVMAMPLVLMKKHFILWRRQVAQHVEAIVYVPIGFVCDHLEILYDNDIACKALCEELNVMYQRVPMPNTDAVFVKAMAQAVRRLPIKDEVKA